MKQLQIGITLDKDTVATIAELLTQIIERATARQTEAVLKVAAEWANRVEGSLQRSPETALPPPTPPVEDAPSKEKSGLINADEVAKLLDVSPRMVWRLRDGGKMPKPLKIGSLVRWPREQIEAWIEAGCPATERRGVSRRS